MNEYIVGEYNLYNIVFIRNRSNYKIFYRGNKVKPLTYEHSDRGNKIYSVKSQYNSQKYDNFVLSTPYMNMLFGRVIYYNNDIIKIKLTNNKKYNTKKIL